MGWARFRGWFGAALTVAAIGIVPAPAGAAGTGAAWVHHALRLQYELGGDVALRNAPWVGTHNSFNSAAEMGPSLSDQDSNQMISLTDQLRAGIRSLEIDLHYFPNGPSGGYAPVVCHARGGDQAHFGCTIEKTLGPVLDEIVAWLHQHPRKVLMLYFEDHLDNQQGYDAAAAIIQQKLGDLLYAPPAGAGCTKLPFGQTRNRISAASKQAFIVSGCGVGAAWQSVIFDWSAHHEGTPHGYQDFPDCGPDFSLDDYRSNLIRYYEDSTHLSAAVDGPSEGITPATAAAMARCGVDLFGLDQLQGPGDPRLASLVWSWAPGQPDRGAGRCAIQRVDADQPYGRWYSRHCGVARPAACRRGRWQWLLTTTPVTEAEAPAACRARGAEYAVPRTGYEAELLRLAMERSGVKEAWLGYRAAQHHWYAVDQRGPNVVIRAPG